MAGSKARGVDHAYQEFYRDVLRKNDPALVPYADDGVDVPLMQLVPNERSILHLTSRRPASWSPSCGRRREAVKQEGCVRRSLLGWTDLGKVSARLAGMSFAKRGYKSARCVWVTTRESRWPGRRP